MSPVLDLEPRSAPAGSPPARPTPLPPGLSIGDAVALPLLLVALLVALSVFVAAGASALGWRARGFLPLLAAQLLAGPAVLALAVRWSGLAPGAALTLRRFPARVLPAAIVAALGLLICFGPLVRFVPGSRVLREATLRGLSAGPRLVPVFTAVIAAPIIEELLCRGVLLRALLRRHSAWTAAIVTALVFAIIHLNPTQGLLALPLGLGLAWLALRTGSVVPGIVVHAAVNGYQVVGAFIVLARGYTPRQILAADHLAAPFAVAAAAAAVLSAFVLWWQLRDEHPASGDAVAAAPRATAAANVLRPVLVIAVAVFLLWAAPRGIRTHSLRALSPAALFVPDKGPPSPEVVAASGCYALDLPPALAGKLFARPVSARVRLTTTRYRRGDEYTARYLVQALPPLAPRDTAPMYWLARSDGGLSIVAGGTLLTVRPRAGGFTGEAASYDVASGNPEGSAAPVAGRRIPCPAPPTAR